MDFSRFEIGSPYTGTYQGKDFALIIDQATEGHQKGRIYYDNGEMVSSPIEFSSNIKKSGKGELWINNQEKSLSEVTVNEENVVGDIDENQFSLNLYQACDLPFKAQYLEPCHDVVVEKGRIYARDVDGFWSSYPDTGGSFVSIYVRKAPSLVATKELDLDMDLYYPKEPFKGKRRPLLVLIHGGAFYNGDKQDVGFPELGQHFAERGYVVASINHRLGFILIGADVDRAGYRALQDTHAAVSYLVNNADEFGIDTTKIFAAGTSAGAITALNLAFMRDENRLESTKNKGVFDWITSTFSRSYNILKGFGILDFGLNLDVFQIIKNLGLDKDLGPINVLSDSLSRPLHIKAVVNMWGAVHSLEVLKNSRQTDILSFHGDSDRIVPYAYGYPFNHVLESKVDTLLNSLPRLVKSVVNLGRKLNGKPFNEWAFNPIYGSSQIHDKAISLGIHSELVTVKGGGHSLHLNNPDNPKSLSAYFNDTIIPKMTHFLCEEMAEGKAIRLERNGSWVEALCTDNVAELHWLVEGGVILNRQGDKKVKVILFGDAPKRCIIAGGKYKNGVEFKASLPDT